MISRSSRFCKLKLIIITLFCLSRGLHKFFLELFSPWADGKKPVDLSTKKRYSKPYLSKLRGTMYDETVRQLEAGLPLLPGIAAFCVALCRVGV